MAERLAPTPMMTSDPEVLKLIKRIQFRRQIVPLGLVVLLLILNLVLPLKINAYLTMAAFGWYVYARMFFRTKHKIAVPDAGCFVSPVDGKIKSIRKGEDTTLITIRKSWLDVVELRLPYTDMTSEFANVWSFHTPKGLVEVRIKTEKINSFSAKNETGAVTAIMPGSAIIVIHLPASIEINVKEKELIFGGETVLFEVDTVGKKQPAPTIAKVEEEQATATI